MIEPASLAVGGFLAVMTAAAALDVATRTIPNGLTLALAAAFAPAALALGLSPIEVLAHAAGAAAVLAAGFLLFAAGWLGGGDAKLAAAAALWLGPEWTPAFLLGTMLAGGALAALMLALQAADATSANAPVWVRKLADTREGAPYGVALAAGAAFVTLRGAWPGAGL